MAHKVLCQGMLLCIALLLGFQYAFGQSLDSLHKTLMQESDPKKRVDIHNSMAWLYWDRDFKLGRLYTDSAYQVASELAYNKGLANALLNKAIAELTIENFNTSLKYFAEALYKAKELNDTALTNNIKRLIANSYIAKGDYKKADSILITLSNTFIPGSSQEAAYLASLGRLYIMQGYANNAEAPLLRSYHIRIDSGYTSQLASSTLLLANVKINQSRLNEAEDYLNRAIQHALNEGQIFRIGNIYVEFADLKIIEANYDTAKILLDKAIEIFEQGPFEYGKMLAYQKYAELYLQSIDYVKAQDYALKGLRYAEQIGAKKYQSAIYTLLAWIYKDEQDFERGLDYINRALEIQQEIGDKRGESTTLNTLGNLYNAQGDFDNALTFLKQSLELRREMGYKRGVSSVLFNIGLIREEQGDIALARELYIESLEINMELDYLADLAYNHNAIASVELKLGNLTKARSQLDKAYASGKKYDNDITMAHTYKLYAIFFEQQHDYKRALDFHKLHKLLSDSLYNIDKSKQLLQMQSRFILDSKDNEIALLNARNEASQNSLDFQQATIVKQKTLIYSISIGLFLMAAIAYVLFIYSRTKSKSNKLLVKLNDEISEQKENLKEANDKVYQINQKLEGMVRERTEKLRRAYNELDTFFYKSSHDFRRPITTFLGLAEVARVTVKDEQALILFEKVKETAVSLDKMLAKLQSISHVGSQDLVFKEVFFAGIVESIISDFIDEIRGKGIKLNYDIKFSGPFKSYPLYISTILENLIENAINFSIEGNPEINIFIFKDERDFLAIQVKDNGAGIPLEYQPKIFDMYYRGSERSKGNGLGLFIVKKAVERLKGNIIVESEYGVGSTFTVRLPMP